MFDNVFDSLVIPTADMKFTPGLATEWKLINDTTWQFKLRPNVKWHDGSPFTSADVKFTIGRSQDPAQKTIVMGKYSGIKSVETPDDLTANFVLKNPDPLFPQRVGGFSAYIMPQKAWTDLGPDGFEKKPIGTGPFKFVEQVKGDHTTLAADPTYWGGAPNVSGATFKPYPEEAARYAALQTGAASIIDFVTPDGAAKINSSGTAQAGSPLYDGMWVLLVNVNVPPLDNKLLRQAMSVAIDRKQIAEKLLLGQAGVPTSWIPAGEFGNDASAPPLSSLAYDPQKAMDLVKQSGYKGEPIVYEARQSENAQTQAIVAMWKAVGINATISQFETSVRSQELGQHKIKGVTYFAPLSGINDPDPFILDWMGKGSLGYYWENAEFDKLVTDGHVELDPAKRKTIYQQITKIYDENIPWITVYQQKYIFGWQKNIQWSPSPILRVDWRNFNLKFGS